MPMDKDSFMNGTLGLGMAIPEDATAKLGPLPLLMQSDANKGREFEVRLPSWGFSVQGSRARAPNGMGGSR